MSDLLRALVTDTKGNFNSCLVYRAITFLLFVGGVVAALAGADVPLDVLVLLAGVVGLLDVSYIWRRGQDRKLAVAAPGPVGLEPPSDGQGG